MIMKTIESFKSVYKISMPLSGIAASWFEHDKNKFAVAIAVLAAICGLQDV